MEMDRAEHKSLLNVNRPQHAEFQDEDGELIEDLSFDPELEFNDVPVAIPGSNQLGGHSLKDILGIDDDMGDDYVEETMDESGHTMRKEVHKHNGWTSVEITGDVSMAGGAVGNIL